MKDGRAFIAALPTALAIQARLLDGLLAAVEADGRWEWLELGCSVAAGRGDAFSDLDPSLGFAGETMPPTDDVAAMLRTLGPVVDLATQPWDGVSRWWVQYADGGQIDLIALPADSRPGRRPGSVALLDRTGRLAHDFTPRQRSAAPDEPRAWLLDGWEALGNVAKYVARGSLLEALDQLHRARGRIYRLAAAGEGVPYPALGLTSLLDEPEPHLPDSIEATYALPSRASVLAAARASARLLHEAGGRAEPGLESPLRDFVGARLDTLDHAGGHAAGDGRVRWA